MQRTSAVSDAAIIAMADPAVRMRMSDFGLEVPPPEQQTPEALGALQKAEIEKWWPVRALMLRTPITCMLTSQCTEQAIVIASVNDVFGSLPNLLSGAE